MGGADGGKGDRCDRRRSGSGASNRQGRSSSSRERRSRLGGRALHAPGQPVRIGIGKVDRQRLPAPGRARPALAEPYAAPRTPVEKEVARIWAEVLDLDEVGVDDLFVDLGGHSLLAGKVVSRVQAAFGVAVPPVRLLIAATVASMAVVIVEHLTDAADSARVAAWLDRASGA